MAEQGELRPSWRWHEPTRLLTLMWEEGGRRQLLTLTEKEARQLYADLEDWLQPQDTPEHMHF